MKSIAFFLWALSAVPSPDYPGVVLNDCKAFAVSQQVARSYYLLSRNHMNFYNDYMATKKNYFLWREDALWCMSCWDKLDDALNPSMGYAKRMQSLATLKKILGEAAYYAGEMPQPTPGWIFGGLDNGTLIPPSKR